MRFNYTIKATAFAAALALAGGVALAAGEHVKPATAFAKSQLAAWMADPAVVAAIKAQNAKHAGLTEGQIVALDKRWRAEVDASSKPMINGILANSLSKYLKGKKDGTQGLVTEIFVMDNKGLNVGQSDPTSDYWQGDESKWKNTYLKGAGTVFVDEVEKDESTQMFQSQVSMAVTDPASGEAIGAVTVGVNVDALK